MHGDVGYLELQLDFFLRLDFQVLHYITQFLEKSLIYYQSFLKHLCATLGIAFFVSLPLQKQLRYYSSNYNAEDGEAANQADLSGMLLSFFANF